MNNHICKAKTISTNEWVQGYYVAKTDPLLGCISHFILCQECDNPTNILSSFMTWYQVDPETLCRYTGVNDQNGNPIFEHDILCGTVYHMFDASTETFEVHWLNEVGGWGLNYFEPSDCVVIGNKFDADNTELMED